MEATEFTRIAGLFEELKNIVQSSSVGSCTEPVWDGTLIGKPRKKPLLEMGFIEYCHGYYFPTKLGMAVYKTFLTDSAFGLKDFAYLKYLEGKEAQSPGVAESPIGE